MKKYGAEFIGTFWLVLGGCGSAVLAAAFPDVGIGLLGVSLAFGLTVMTMAYAVGHISGGHFNPAVSLGLMIGGRFDAKDLIPYWIAQVLGAIALGASMYLNYSFWPTVCFIVGLVCLVAGLVVLLKRRDYRVTDRRVGQRQDY